MCCGGSGGNGGGSNGGGGESTYDTPIGQMSITATETEWGTKYQIRDASGNLVDATKFSTKEKAERGLERAVNFKIGQSNAVRAAPPKQQSTTPRKPASGKQKKYLQDLADTKGANLKKEFGLTNDKINRMSSKQASYVISQLKTRLSKGDYTGDYMENM